MMAVLALGKMDVYGAGSDGGRTGSYSIDRWEGGALQVDGAESLRLSRTPGCGACSWLWGRPNINTTDNVIFVFVSGPVLVTG